MTLLQLLSNILNGSSTKMIYAGLKLNWSYADWNEGLYCFSLSAFNQALAINIYVQSAQTGLLYIRTL